MKTGLALVCVALGAAAAGFIVYRHWAMPPIAPATLNPSATATPAAMPAPAPGATATVDTAPKRVIPETVPEISLADLAGKSHSLREFRGRPTIYNFWATWCAPCRREIPLLNKLQREFAGQRLQIVGIAVDFNDDVAKYAQATPVDYPLLVGEQGGLEAAEKFGMEMALPFSIFVDSRQRIVAAKLGELHRDDADVIITALLAVDRNQLALAEAKARISTKLRELAQARAGK
jgi:thiol-disulfide isomerase/thioredoxin